MDTRSRRVVVAVVSVLAASAAFYVFQRRNDAQPLSSPPLATSNVVGVDSAADIPQPDSGSARPPSSAPTGSGSSLDSSASAHSSQSKHMSVKPAGAPVLKRLSEDDENLLDTFATDLEANEVSGMRRLNESFEAEARDPAWAGRAEADLAGSLQSMFGTLANVRVGDPVCKASICLLRAIGPPDMQAQGANWQAAAGMLGAEPWWSERFDDGSTTVALRNGETVYLTYIYRRCRWSGTC